MKYIIAMIVMVAALAFAGCSPELVDDEVILEDVQEIEEESDIPQDELEQEIITEDDDVDIGEMI